MGADRPAASGLSAILHEVGRFAPETAILRNISKRVTLPCPPQRKGTSGRVSSSFFLGLESGPEQIFKRDGFRLRYGLVKKVGTQAYTHIIDFDEEDDHKPLKSIGFWGTFTAIIQERPTISFRSWCTLCLCTLPAGGQGSVIWMIWMASWSHETSQYISPQKSSNIPITVEFLFFLHGYPLVN